MLHSIKKISVHFICLMCLSNITSAQCWKEISCMGDHSMALRSDGTIWEWGGGDYNTPTQIGTDTNWVFISDGYRHHLAIKSDKTRWIEDRTIFYEFDPSRRGGKYSWEYYPSDVGALYTKAFVARAMYHINDE